ncbi:transketolase family protein [Pyrofollis japonicus]|uniref:transketolase family protein n=1 Tax=Pyrofollis japonicus TaxID=3060460 RepID=UPI00295AE82C|nr:transketolase C-terminal domain-containing protein [Pyrofollis japonicus]
MSSMVVAENLGAMRDAVGKALLYLGDIDRDVVVVTADVARSTRTKWFGDKYPERFVNIGISEQDMVGFTAGLALAGKKPYAAAFAMFMMRAWEQIRNTIDRMRLNVKLIATHSGFSDHGDGASHQSLEDIAVMRVLHNMAVVVPADAFQAYKALIRLHEVHGPAYMRIGRDYSPQVTDPGAEYRFGRLEVLRDGSDVAVVSAGPVLAHVIEAAKILEEKGISVAVANLHTVKPVDEAGLVALAQRTGLVIVVEEHFPRGGVFGAVAETLAQHYPVPIIPVAPRGYGHSARSILDLYERHGLMPRQIARSIAEAVERWRK